MRPSNMSIDQQSENERAVNVEEIELNIVRDPF